jgi:C4-dicarboxylate-specific signal transduction histidine kinase
MDNGANADLRRQCEELQRQLRCREEELQRARQYLIEWARTDRCQALGPMVAQMIHEIGQPLYAIGNYAAACAQALRAESSPRMTELCGWVSQIAEQSSRAAGIVRSLNHSLRKLSPQFAAVDLNGVCREALALVENGVRDQGISLRFVAGPALPPVRADRIQIGQVLATLLKNAAEAIAASPEGEREIMLSTAHQPPWVSVSVGHTGREIPAADLPQLFDPCFCRPEALGLAVSHAIVAAHGGTLSARRNLGRGATFFLTIPVSPEQ